jgi:cyclic beta-1,2-glucan synthetase
VGDPIASLCLHIELGPNESVQLAFVTAVAGSRVSVLENSERYRILHALDWVVADAASEAARQLVEIGVEGSKLPQLQQLASLLVHPRRRWRGDAGTLRENRLGQPRLWGMGISGDVPILLVETPDPDTSTLLRDLIVGQRLWREKGLVVDLVVLRSGSSGYVEPVGEKLLSLLEELGARERLGHQGGVHFLVADQMSPEDRRLLRSVARVVLDAGAGSLAEQLRDPGPGRALPPAFGPSRWDAALERTTPLERASDLVFDNGFGGFSPDGREYVIHLEPGETTPAPWSNVLANDRFGCLVTESGGGFTWHANSGENRLTPWTNDPVSDAAGEALYLRDEETGVVWTPTPAPAGGAGAHEIRHSAGSTQFRSNAEGLAQTLRIFVPPDDPVKVLHLHLHNEWDRPRRLTATCYVEWVLGVGRRESALHVVPEYDPTERALLARNPWSPEFAECVAFLSSSAEPHGVTADREEFIGRGGSRRAPAALARWGLSNQVEPGGDPCGALQVHLELAPGGSCDVHFVLGQGRDHAEALDLVRRWRAPEAVTLALERTRAYWDDLLGGVQVRTPEPAMDLMLNRWLLYQAIACRLLGRSAFYQSGGAFGFRDQLQDALCLVHVDPVRLRSQLLECAAHQFEEGDVLHWWHPPSGRGVRTRCSDDLLWLPYATAHYVESTGDESVLDERVAYLHAPPLADEEAERYALFPSADDPMPLFDHCLRSLERGVTRGSHGLPLIGTGDWNDGMNRIGERGAGESVWLGWFAIAALRGFAAVCDRRGEVEVAEQLRHRAAGLAHALEDHGWDGAWYRRAWDDEGRPLGTHDAEECRIDSIAQSWSVLSGAGRPARVNEALRSADDALVREQDGLVRLLWPPFDLTLRDPGYIRAYPPGVRENGGQYTHAAAWLGWAWATLGEPDRAMRIFRLIEPVGHAQDHAAAEHYRVEPYVIAADVASVPPHVGQGGWTWYTGAAAWTWRLGVEAILGIRRVAGGLRVEPCIPPDWGEAEVRYRGPKGVLVISIRDPEGVGRGVARIELDGELLETPIVPLPDDGGEHSLVVNLGR